MTATDKNSANCTETFDQDIESEELEQIAVIGLAGRFPGARNIDEFWQNLCNGVDSLHEFTDEELDELGIPAETYQRENFVRRGTILPDMDRFDAAFFGYSPGQAAIMDPQARIFLETCYEALENAGYDPYAHDEPIGVFAGSNPNDYATLLGVADPVDSLSAFDQMIGTDRDFLATRVSYRLNLTGPALNLQTACSTSLVAVHTAAQSLLDYQCTIALAGGVSVNLRQGVGYFYQQGMILAPDGRCRAFDAKAAGTTLGQAVGVVVLKRLSEALKDGDHIYAVMKASAINNDGSSKISYTAPSEDGQAAVIAMAHSLAGVSADEVSYVETHGTGTSLGDPIEIAALNRAFSAGTERTGYCAIGSVKTNVGHTDAAAGVTGFIKTVLALKNCLIPPSLHFESPNPAIELDRTPFFVNTQLRDWDNSTGPLRAGVSSFGIGGTNAHAVLEEPPERAASSENLLQSAQLLVMSARTEAAVEKIASNLADHLEANPTMSLSDICYTLQVGRPDHEYRRIVVADSNRAAVQALRGNTKNRIYSGGPIQSSARTVFMFSGQGAQYPQMTRDLYRSEPLFREELNRCFNLFEAHLRRDLRSLIFVDDREQGLAEAAELLRQTQFTQPALFAIEYAIARLLISWGIKPVAVVGHSIGEYAAATIAGIFSLEDAVRLVYERGRLMQEMLTGSMLAVQCPATEIEAMLIDSVELAASNSTRLSVVSGPDEAIAAFQQLLESKDIGCQKLHTSHAFHSQMLRPMVAEFRALLDKVEMSAPEIPMLSNITGTWLQPEEAVDPSFWASQICSPVRFADDIAAIADQENLVLVEIGPGQSLATFARQHSALVADTVVINTIRHPNQERNDTTVMLEALGRIWVAGVHPDWKALHGNQPRHRIPLPTYPFERKRHWRPNGQHVLAIKKADEYPSHVLKPAARNHIDDWYYVPSWKRGGPAKPTNISSWLIFTTSAPPALNLSEQLKIKGGQVISVAIGSAFAEFEDGFNIDPCDDEHYKWLFEALDRRNQLPDKVVHLWAATSGAEQLDSLGGLKSALDIGVNSVLAIARGLASSSSVRPFCIDIVTAGAHSVTGLESVHPPAAAILGPCKVIPLEYTNIACRNIDLSTSFNEVSDLTALLNELASDPVDVSVALRGSHRWTHTVEPVHIPSPNPDSLPLKQGGVYLIVGGLGGVGLSIASHLASVYQAKLALTSRSGRPQLQPGEVDTERTRRIELIERIERVAGGLAVLEADASSYDDMCAAVEQAEQELGSIDGVIFTAAVADNAGSIHRRIRQEAEDAIASKVYGALIVEQIFSNRRLDFILLSSSIATMLYHNRFAQVGYVTANSFVESFAYRPQKSGTPIITLSWDDWKMMGMSVKAAHEFSETYGSDIKLMDEMHSYTPEEGIRVFEHALSTLYPLIYISTTDLRERVKNDVNVVSPFLEQAMAQDSDDLISPDSVGDDTRSPIRAVWQDLLGFESISENDDFFELGGESLQVARMADRLTRLFEVSIPLYLIFDNPTIAQLDAAITGLKSGNSDTTSATDQGEVTGAVPLSPGQLRFLSRGSANPNHFNVSILAKPSQHLDPVLLQQVWAALIGHNDALRLRIRNGPQGWEQHNEPNLWEEGLFIQHDLSGHSESEQEAEVASIASGLQSSLNLDKGPLTRLALFDLGSRGQRILLLIHHLAADRVSLLMLLDSIANTYHQLNDSGQIDLPPKTASYQRWTNALVDYTHSTNGADDYNWWLSLNWEGVAPIPLDHEFTPDSNSNVSARDIKFRIDNDVGLTLLRGSHARSDELILLALASTLRVWTGSDQVLIDTLGHGRRIFGTNVDISRTVGYFLSYSPLLLDFNDASSMSAQVELIRDLSTRGWTLDALRYLGTESQQQGLTELPNAQVLFNFVGRRIGVDDEALLVPVDEDKGSDTDPFGLRDHPLAIYAEIDDKGIEFTVVYSSNLHEEKTMAGFVKLFEQALSGVTAAAAPH